MDSISVVLGLMMYFVVPASLFRCFFDKSQTRFATFFILAYSFQFLIAVGVAVVAHFTFERFFVAFFVMLTPNLLGINAFLLFIGNHHTSGAKAGLE